ncbi:hypothetical protein DFH07DRAFT_909305 [Mycena maculata]|uniref:F-box domain-containing protein n=1 Tax=Mycena maculata TaxID=230809 RepID=A0AAD7NZZ5_9AGAR|nr:hypothetical protein DFH07DRAFT_909305 [Mycena maculata]
MASFTTPWLTSTTMSSPFATRLATKYCPTDDEVLEIKALLVEPTLKAKGLDDEIAELQKAIDKLTQERDSLVAYVEAHKALIAPMRRLPLDIIQEIFVACLPTHRNCVMSAIEAPVILGRICSSWRAISLSTHRLWDRLHVVEPTRTDRSLSTFDVKYAQRIEMTKTWLDRSGACALSISLESGFDLSANPQPASDLFLRALIPYSSRWHRIAFTIPTSVTQSLGHLTENDVPMLQDITIHERTEHRPGSVNMQWIFRGPQISSFSVSRPGFGRMAELPLRWSQLTALSLLFYEDNSVLTGLTSKRALEILSRCPQLRMCSLSIYDDNSTVEGLEVDPIVECPFLNTIELVCGGNSTWTIQRMFKCLSLPGLRHVKLGGYSSPDHEMLSISHFLAVATQLEGLDIWANIFSKTSLIDLLRRLPHTIQQLKISQFWAPEPAVDDDILAILTPSDDLSSICCPALRELSLSQCVAFSDAALLRLITFRMTTESCAPLQHVEVQSSTREMEFDLFARLQSFIDAGLIVSLQYQPPVSPFPQFSPWSGLEDDPAQRGPYGSVPY